MKDRIRSFSPSSGATREASVTFTARNRQSLPDEVEDVAPASGHAYARTFQICAV